MLVEETKWSDYSAGRDAMLRLLKKTRPTAVIASNQTLAIGIQAALLESGLRIPQDMSVISYHDSPLASISVPPMTVVKMPLYEMGYRAAEALIHLIQGGESAVPIMLPPDGLVLRSSTCRPLAEI
jgi:DNA-binding LacI/PurR family transcriptional regulator